MKTLSIVAASALVAWSAIGGTAVASPPAGSPTASAPSTKVAEARTILRELRQLKAPPSPETTSSSAPINPSEFPFPTMCSSRTARSEAAWWLGGIVGPRTSDLVVWSGGPPVNGFTVLSVAAPEVDTADDPVPVKLSRAKTNGAAGGDRMLTCSYFVKVGHGGKLAGVGIWTITFWSSRAHPGRLGMDRGHPSINGYRVATSFGGQ